MKTKILIISKKETNLSCSIIYYLEKEEIDYEICEEISSNISDSVTNIIYIDYSDDYNQIIYKLSIPIIFISDSKRLISNENIIVNYIITSLVNDEVNYSVVQREYLYKKDVYRLINEKIYEFINNENETNGLVVDFDNVKTKLKDWVFKFDSIAETYAWLYKQNEINSNNNFLTKTVNFYHKKIYNDSAKEINYLIGKIRNIKEKQNLIDLFICTEEELANLKNNYFFKLLLQNTCETYCIYIIDRNRLKEKEPLIYDKFLDGIMIYEDCVYRDTYNDEYSLGMVDCKQVTIDEYNKYFDYVIETYGIMLCKGDN